MFKQAMRAYLEGRGSLSAVERALAGERNSAALQRAAEKELATEWRMKAHFAAQPAPPKGLPRLLSALRAAAPPALDATQAGVLAELRKIRSGLENIPAPANGYPAACSALKQKIADAPLPQRAVENEDGLDIQAHLEAAPARQLVLLESSRKRGVTRKIIGLPRHPPGSRDVLAAQKDDGEK